MNLKKLSSHIRGWSLARQMLALQIVVVGVTVAGGATLAFLQAGDLLRDEAAGTARAVAVSVADSPSVLAAMGDSAVLQPYAERVRRETGVDFVTIMGVDGVRYTHPNPAQIGHRFLGTIAPALAGRTFTETYTGTLGPSVRAVAPVRDARGRVTGLVSAGITIDRISARLREQIAGAALIGVLGLSVGGAGTYLVGSRLRRQTHGMGPAELSRMYEYHDAILHAVREGLLLVDPSGTVTLCNDGARELLGLDGEVAGRRITALGLPASLAERLSTGENRTDEIHMTGERTLVVNAAVVRSGSRSLGTVVTLRDHTELQSLAGQLDAERGFADSLRAAAHEAANRLHTVIALVELGRTEQAVAFATEEIRAAQRLTDRVVDAVREPVLAALLLGKSAEAGERGVELVITPDSGLDDIGLDSRDLVTILGNLIDNAVDAAMTGAPPARVEVRLRVDETAFLISVADSGPGLDPATAGEAFRRGWTTKGDGRGLGLAMVGQAVRRLGGTIDVGPPAGTAGPGIGETGTGAVFTVRLPLRGKEGS
ncbi:sensor histidine kinase regulating citrate/malate metabolism [Streptosporangium becharense]|uniref:histidine kinase n=1 Tax=Streptosporangium becharense TaxID=1816182 RepID=A0A7W9IBL0_9ACTN|nr:sensor histidine kinase [Streptosporangium becharense]MBB2913659.1 sensor histidine kinase regulating citrate/malate metabolism [Streptosporangium becharense]MBB5817740.1 sensor histidine kinase regulating citrate/malate metabolism [Streptosporangium becharense]